MSLSSDASVLLYTNPLLCAPPTKNKYIWQHPQLVSCNKVHTANGMCMVLAVVCCIRQRFLVLLQDFRHFCCLYFSLLSSNILLADSLALQHHHFALFLPRMCGKPHMGTNQQCVEQSTRKVLCWWIGITCKWRFWTVVLLPESHMLIQIAKYFFRWCYVLCFAWKGWQALPMGSQEWNTTSMCCCLMTIVLCAIAFWLGLCTLVLKFYRTMTDCMQLESEYDGRDSNWRIFTVWKTQL